MDRDASTPSGLPFPSADCPSCGAWVPCAGACLVLDPKQLTGPPVRWVSVESPRDALVRHLGQDCR